MKNFEDPMEGMSDIPRSEEETFGLPKWILDNLESSDTEPKKATESIMPETEKQVKEDRELTSLEVIEGIFRDFFQKILGVSESTDSTNEGSTVTMQSLSQETAEETSDTASPMDRYNLDAATDQWHVQLEDYSCANACQTFIINEYLDTNVDEAELNDLARQQGWYQSNGTAFMDIGNLLDEYGIENYRTWNADFQDVKNAVDQGDRVIVCVYNAALDDEWGDQFPVASANHAVEVLGVDDSDPNDVKVIVNDPGVSDGCGKVVSLDTFNRARETSGGFMVVADRP